MENYQKATFKLTNTELNNLNSTAKNKTGTTLIITRKIFQDQELPHELLLTTRQKTKIKNIFTDNMPTNIKLSNSQLAKMNQSGRFLGKKLVNSGKKALLNLAVPLAKEVLSKLVTKVTSFVTA